MTETRVFNLLPKNGQVLGEPDVHELDPNWQWINVATFRDPGPVYIRGMCLHKTPAPIPVDSSVTGEIVAHICATCDEQLP